MITTCKGRFVHCNQWSTLVGDVGNGGGYVSVEVEGIWEISVPSAHFCSEHILPPKIKTI